MNKLVQQIADQIIYEIDEHIDNTIAWQLETDAEGDELAELELQIKQQVLFSLIKTVTK